MQDITRAQFNALPMPQKDCLLLFVASLFEDNYSSNDFNSFRLFMRPRIVENLLEEKKTSLSFEGRTIRPPSAPLVQPILQKLSKIGYLIEMGSKTNASWGRSAEFYELAEILFKQVIDLDNDAAVLMESSKQTTTSEFVLLDHNSEEVKEADLALRVLEDNIVQSNEFEANDDERNALVCEVKSIRALLLEPVIRVAAIWEVTKGKGVLVHLAGDGITYVVRECAKQAIAALIKLATDYLIKN